MEDGGEGNSESERAGRIKARKRRRGGWTEREKAVREAIVMFE